MLVDNFFDINSRRLPSRLLPFNATVNFLLLGCYCFFTTGIAMAEPTVQPNAKVYVAPEKDDLPHVLGSLVVKTAQDSISQRGVFTIALSGGSAASSLSLLRESFDKAKVDPQFSSWHVILADERCVPTSDGDSNYGALKSAFFDQVDIPEDQIHGINEALLSTSDQDSMASNVAADYEAVVKDVLAKSDNKLDLAILGFGPDGHTCSLFPDHPLLSEMTKLVGSIEDSPKPPPKRITLTMLVLNQMTRNVVFCGAGSSKSPILKNAYESLDERKECDAKEHVSLPLTTKQYDATYTVPPPYPCAMVQAVKGTSEPKVNWVVDAEAMSETPMSKY